jgi:LPS export ABC transporter protein LptC
MRNPSSGAVARRLEQWTFAAAVAAAAVLAGCNKDKATPVRPGQGNRTADSADQVMFGINTLLNNRGLLQAELQSDTGYFFDENTRIELRGVNLTFYSKTGEKTSNLKSLQGTYNTRMQLAEARQNVVMVSTDGRRLTTNQLRFDQGRNEISSDSAFIMTEPGKRLEGVGFTSDPELKAFRIKGVKGTRGSFTIPGQ